MPSSQRACAVSVFRELLRLSHRLPETTRGQSLQQVREQFRANRAVTDAAELERLMKAARDRLSFLRMVTPKSRRDGQTGRTRLVYRGGGAGEGGRRTCGPAPRACRRPRAVGDWA